MWKISWENSEFLEDFLNWSRCFKKNPWTTLWKARFRNVLWRSSNCGLKHFGEKSKDSYVFPLVIPGRIPEGVRTEICELIPDRISQKSFGRFSGKIMDALRKFLGTKKILSECLLLPWPVARSNFYRILHFLVEDGSPWASIFGSIYEGANKFVGGFLIITRKKFQYAFSYTITKRSTDKKKANFSEDVLLA